MTDHRHDVSTGPDGSGSRGNLAGHLEDHPRWIAIPPSNARRIVVIILTAMVLLWVATWAFAAMSGFLFLLLLAWLLSIAMEPVVLWLTVFLLTLFGIEYGVLRPLDRFVHRWRALT